jgi:hypothetical protein
MSGKTRAKASDVSTFPACEGIFMTILNQPEANGDVNHSADFGGLAGQVRL